MDGITDSMDVYLSKLWEIVEDREACQIAIQREAGGNKQGDVGPWAQELQKQTLLTRHLDVGPGRPILNF